MLTFTDTHCHIHDPEFFPDGGRAEYERALAAGVRRIICVGTDSASTRASLMFTENRPGVYTSFGIHPHDAVKELPGIEEFLAWCHEHKTEKVIAVGEIGLDYYYMNSPRDQQIALLERQIDLALQLSLPVLFHVRDGFDDFWPIFANFQGVRGVLHSFTDSVQNMEKGLERGLYIGVNGIATFARDRDKVTSAVPLDRILLETDAPFLTPAPNRGKINEPGNIPFIASYVAALRSVSVEELSHQTEQNVTQLFF